MRYELFKAGNALGSWYEIRGDGRCMATADSKLDGGKIVKSLTATDRPFDGPYIECGVCEALPSEPCFGPEHARLS